MISLISHTITLIDGSRVVLGEGTGSPDATVGLHNDSGGSVIRIDWGGGISTLIPLSSVIRWDKVIKSK